MIHLLRMAAVVALTLLATLLPCLPGDYDPVASPLSMIARAVGILSVLLVPVGLLWWVSLYSSALAAKQRALRLVTLAVLALVLALGAFAALLNSAALGMLFIPCALFALSRLARRAGGVEARAAAATGAYLVVIPVSVLTLQLLILPSAGEFSRTRAIRNSETLIADIEAYRATHGRYPVSLLSLHPDYKPSIKGIPRYHYELNGDSYNVLFEHTSGPIGTQEVVVYNPRGEHQATAHAMDLLQYAPELLNRTRGYHAVHEVTAHPRWKYFWFD